MTEFLSSLTVPVILCAVAVAILAGRRDYFTSFLNGAKTGMNTAFSLLPPMLALIAGLSMLNASGAVQLITGWLSPLSEKIGIPAGLFPLILTRPVSGSASSATFAQLIDTYGADSFTVMCAAIILGSSDTILYVCSVYFSTTGIKKTRHAIPISFAVMIFCIFFACFLGRLFF